LPANAAIDPPAEPRELNNLVADNDWWVWTPSGLFSCPRAWRISELLGRPDQRTAHWDVEVADYLRDRLTDLSGAPLGSWEQMIENSQGDIGETPDGQLPASPHEPKPGALEAIKRSALRTTARAIQRLTSSPQSGHSAGGTTGGGVAGSAGGFAAGTPSLFGNLRNWANDQLRALNEGIEAARNTKLSRLIHMLENDPDQGLRFAIPLGGDSPRGVARPSGELFERDVDFHLGGYGGPSADVWSVDDSYRLRLMSLYRQLANREQQIGRHRRAAYIFAHLLFDMSAAASALEAGGHWREAAVLYRDRLGQKDAAARCLEQARAWNDAIQLHKELKNYFRAGEIHHDLGQIDEADEMFQMAVVQHRNHGEYLEAAAILEHQLRLPNDALAVLRSAWPSSHQAAPSVRAEFELLGRLERHEDAVARLDEIADETPRHRRVELSHVLAELSLEYPAPSVREGIGDKLRVMVGESLAADRADSRKLLAAVQRATPEDELLKRDCDRFVRTRPPARAPAPQLSESADQLRLVNVAMLPSHVQWCSLDIDGQNNVYAAGFSDGRLQLARCDIESGDTQRPLGGSWRGPAAAMQYSDGLLIADLPRPNHVLVHFVGNEPIAQRAFPKSRLLPSATIGSPGGVTGGLLGAARAAAGAWILEIRNDDISLLSITEQGQTRAISWTTSVDSLLTEWGIDFEEGRRCPMCIAGRELYLGIGAILYSGNLDSFPEQHQLKSSRVTSLAAPRSGERRHIAAAFEEGGEFHWCDENEALPFAAEMESPTVGFNSANYLIAASDTECLVYNTQKPGRLALRLIAKIHDEQPLFVGPAKRPNQFIIGYQTGRLCTYEW
jgi:tetratricopeptide (TPR) repeat protein